MRSLIPLSVATGRTKAACDPAPSRWRYRVVRWWLRPRVRLALTVVLPLALGAALFSDWAMRAETQTMLRDTMADLRDAVRARPEFVLTALTVTGGSAPLRAQIEETVSVGFPVSSLALDLDAVRARVADLSAVAWVRVRVTEEGLLSVQVRERRPEAILRHGDALFLIGGEGHRVARLASRAARPDLPLLAGTGATHAVPEALALMAQAAPVGPRIRGLVRVGARRWDLVLDRDQRIMLPARDPDAALRMALALHASEGLLDRDITHIDLRDPDRPVLRLGPDALTTRRSPPKPDAAVPAEET
ncbi:MAG: cell division protein FtsQ/DivIB [Pseudomonadota bacterium]